MVEAQHRISTNRLAASAEDQALLEDLVEEVKPTLPPATRGLQYLLATPFRYGLTKASRFRRADARPGIFYASETVATAVAETAYWRLLFFSRSPGFRPPTSVVEHSAFTVPDVIDFAYTGNRLHPTQKPVASLRPLIECFTKKGDLVLDPFCGSGSTLEAAAGLDRDWLGIELDSGYHATASRRLGCPVRQAA